MADRVAITGSFCPPHIGHSYLEVTALEAGYEPVIIIGNNPDKIYDPNLKNNRIRLCKELFRSNVYSSDTTNLGDFAKRKGCLKILRGYRNDKDYEYELDLAEWNRVNNGLETVLARSPENLEGISSSTNSPLKIKLTGKPGVGKTTILRSLKEQGYCTISIDDMVHKAYDNPVVKTKLIGMFGTANRKELSRKVVEGHILLQDLEDFFEPLLINEFNHLTRGRDPFVFIEDARNSSKLIEYDLTIRIESPEEDRKAVLKSRGLDAPSVDFWLRKDYRIFADFCFDKKTSPHCILQTAIDFWVRKNRYTSSR